MNLGNSHPEDVKAALRKRFGSVAKFERAVFLPAKSVNDLLRGRASARVQAAIESALSTPLPQDGESEVSDDNAEAPGAHRLNAEAR